MLFLITFGLNDLPQILTVAAVIALVVGYVYREIKKEGGSRKDEVIAELTTLVTAHKGKIEDLTAGLEGCKAEHARCERSINSITALNLRLQARQQLYEKTINRLELRLGIELTDFIDVSHEDPNLG